MALPEGLTLVDQEPIKVPEGLTLLDEEKGISEPDTPPEPVTEKAEYDPMPKDYLKGQFSADEALDRQLALSAWKTEQTNIAAQKGELGTFSEGFQKTVNPLRPVVDVATDEVTGILKALKTGIEYITPESVTDKMESLGAELYKSDINKQMTDFVTEGGSALLNEWRKLDRDTRKNIETTGILAMFTPVGKTASKSAEKLASMAGKVTGKGSIALTKGLKNQRLHKAGEFVRPPLQGKYLKDSISRMRDGRYIPTPDEVAKQKVLVTVPDYKPTKSDLYNRNVVAKELDKANVKLDVDIKTHGSLIQQRSVERQIDDAVVALSKNDSGFVGVSPRLPLIELGKTKQNLANNIKANNGVLDSYVVHQTRKDLNDAIDWKTPFKDRTPADKVNSIIYENLNKIVDSTVKGVNVKPARERIGHLIGINANASARVSKDLDGIIQTAMKVGFNSLSKAARFAWGVKTAAKFAGAGAAVGALGVASVPLATLGVAGYIGHKAIVSRTARQGIAHLLATMTRLSKTVKDKAKLAEINSSKEALVKLLASTTVQEEVEE